LRIDGVLTDRIELDGNTASSFFSRLLIMAKLDITEKVMPQDGSFKVTCDNRDVEFRIACMPGIFGQNIVLRLLSGAESVKLGLENCGMLSDELQIIKNTTKYPHGMVLVAGPTGSGKSTTLYCVLESIADPRLKFITIEDPVERRIAGVQQIQVRINRNEPERSLTFARGLRTILRLDPDIILVGEIRDSETAQIAIQASLTGHLVLSTIHANSAVETLRRLENIGVDFHLLMSSLNLIFAQRLLRRLCPDCRETVQLSEKQCQLLKKYQPETIFRARGCQSCLRMGYRGRTGIFEFLPISESIRDEVAEHGLTESMKMIRENRIRSLFESALIKVAEGKTDFGELERVCGPCL
jgi:general secretion pathway protein E